MGTESVDVELWIKNHLLCMIERVAHHLVSLNFSESILFNF